MFRHAFSKKTKMLIHKTTHVFKKLILFSIEIWKLYKS